MDLLIWFIMANMFLHNPILFYLVRKQNGQANFENQFGSLLES